MARLLWGRVNDRVYEGGLDRGVLYLPGVPGVVWNGLVSIEETPEGGEPEPYYLDGLKYLNLPTYEEYSATLETLSAPIEFNQCDGRKLITGGLTITNQKRAEFGLSYRTRIGNALQGYDRGYKIHLVYNALATPTNRHYETLGENVDPMSLTWEIKTRPENVFGYRPTSHFIINSTDVSPGMLRYLEDILYGTNDTIPRMPSGNELIAIFNSTPPLILKNLVTNPSTESTDGKVVVYTNRFINPSMENTGHPVPIYVNEFENPSFQTADGTEEFSKNYAINPDVIGLTGWSTYGGGTGDSTVVLTSEINSDFGRVARITALQETTNMHRVDITPVRDDAPITPDSDGRIFFTFWARTDILLPIQPSIRFRPVSNFGSITDINFSLDIPITTDWTLIRVSCFDLWGIPYIVSLKSTDNAIWGKDHWLEMARPTVTKNFLVDPFSGSNSSDPAMTPSWLGTPNGSPSILTANKVKHVPGGIQSGEWSTRGDKSLYIPPHTN